MKNTHDPIGNRTRDLPTFSAALTNCATAYPQSSVMDGDIRGSRLELRPPGNKEVSQTSVHELNSFLKVVRKPKCSKTETIFPIGINVKLINPLLNPR